ncbi:type II toxin-antitoxin system HipA family toxin [Microbacterium sp.]|uniref:type II toxin-antitoxin system HipA family toxin n=1 Tax=Microbacterium sp. TaxID=51671 RepID=UPI003F9BA499
MTDTLVVRLEGTQIGELHPTGLFTWIPQWNTLAPLNSPVLSHSIPFGASDADVSPFLGGLLPEGAGLERLAREARISSRDLFGLLAEVGADVGGAVTIGEPRPPMDPVVIEEDEYERILERAAGYLRGANVGGGGSAATGVQPKVALTWDASREQWLIGRGSTPSTHLLKPVPLEHADRIRAESHLNEIARQIGLSTHSTRLEPAGDRLVLVVERYDRVRVGADVGRLHQEDAAQALGLAWGGNDKYESVNPRASLRNIARLLPHSALSAEASERERLLALTVLNVAAGNTDAHAKNHSFLLPDLRGAFETRGERATLADAYDVVPQTLFDPEFSPLSLRINGRSVLSDVTASDVVAEGSSWGIAPSRASEVVSSTLQSILRAVETQPTVDRSTERTTQLLREQSENLLRGDRAWTRALPPAIAL